MWLDSDHNMHTCSCEGGIGWVQESAPVKSETFQSLKHMHGIQLKINKTIRFPYNPMNFTDTDIQQLLHTFSIIL